jgi:hypothetical protein
MKKSLLLLWVVFSCQLGLGENLSPEVAKQSFYHASQILKEFPPNKYYVIALGVSNAGISSGLRTVIGDSRLADQYLVDLPLTGFYQPAPPPEVMGKIFLPKEQVGNRKPVVLRVLEGGGVISVFSHLFKDYKDGNPKSEIGLVNGYLVSNWKPEHLAKDLSAKLGGRVIIVEDKVTTSSTVSTRAGRINRKEEGNLPTFTRFMHLKAIQFAEGNPLVENTIWKDLDRQMRVFFDESSSPIPLEPIRAQLRKLAATSKGSLYEHYNIRAPQPCDPLEKAK